MNGQFIYGFIITSFIWIVIIVIFYRVSKVQKEELVKKHNRFVHVVENSTDFIYYAQVYPEIKYKYLSPSAENFFGEGSIAGAYISAEVAFRDIHPEDYDILIRKIKGEVDYSKGIIQRWKDKDGKYRWFEEYATPVYENGKLVALQGVLRCIDERKELENQLEYRLYHDNLTDIYNREYFETVFEIYNHQINAPVAIIICDLDELKFINDNYGHKEGDALIKETARLLSQFSSEKITVARLGGDEFAMIVVETSKDEVNELINHISMAVEVHNESDSKIRIKMSLGYEFAYNSKGFLEELFSQADKNMYKVKAEKKELLV
jgi:diguanylate cyclase (GGDEF)-like protein/PAS domain S-box-containing protein